MDIILTGGNLYTMDKENPKATAVAISGGVIMAVGCDEEILALKTENTELIDLGGKTLLPGFNDSHCHLLGYANNLSLVNLNGAASINELIDRYKNFIESNNIPAGTAVVGAGWNQSFFGEKTSPTKYDLDKISDTHPIFAYRACHHVCSVNSLTLKKLGINKDTPEVDGGEIVREENGEPSGIFNETAMSLLEKDEDNVTIADIEALILKAIPNLHKMGITSVQSDDYGPDYKLVYDAYVNLAKAGKLKLRVNEQCRVSGLENYKKMLELPQVDDDIAPYFKQGPVKILADGSLGGRTAYMKEDYRDDPGNRGIPIYAREEFDAIVDLCHEKDRPVAIHAIGDGIMQWCMDAIRRN